MNFSSWNSIKKTGRRNPILSPAHVVVEFERTKQQKIFAHKLGAIDFVSNNDLNINRQKVIDVNINKLTSSGFVYKNIGHVYSSSNVIPRVNGDNYSYEILSHGHPLGGSSRIGKESCTMYGLKCAEGFGTDSKCNPAKCVIGTLEKINDSKWKYTSKNTYGNLDLPLVYYLPSLKSVELPTVVRGIYTTYSSAGDPIKIEINKPASINSTILLPPVFYFSEDFLDSYIRNSAGGIEDRKEKFIRKIITSTYPQTSEGYTNERLYSITNEKIKDSLSEYFSDLDEEWKSRCSEIITQEFSSRFLNSTSGFDFIARVYDRIKSLLRSVVQTTNSFLKASKVEYKKDSISRPIYSRLPGISEGYRTDPAFSSAEAPSKWLVSGADEFLSNKKDSIASFYLDYLDPDKCNPALLDWLAQHLGLFGPLWNPDWDKRIKRLMINNAFGWWDRTISTELPGRGSVLTLKGETLNKFPFTNKEWAENSEQENFLRVKFDEKERFVVFDNKIYYFFDAIKLKSFSDETNKVSLDYVDTVTIDKTKWNGLIESKGSFLNVMFLTSALGLKAHSPLELEVTDINKKVFKPRTGLREAEINAPVLTPYKPDTIQVGTVEDAKINNFTNQLIADVSKVCTPEQSKVVFFRMPYYYNRDGRSWDKVSYIASNWMPSNLNVRIQYPYLSADLWAVGDAFFELEIIDEGIIEEGMPLLITEDGSNFLTLEDGTQLIYNY